MSGNETGMAQLTLCTDLFGNDSGGKGQRLVGQKVAIIGSRELQSEVCSQSKRSHRILATYYLRLQKSAAREGGHGPSRFSHCVKLLYTFCVKSEFRYPRTTPSRNPFDAYEAGAHIHR